MYKAKYVKTGASKRRSNKKAVTLLISLLLLTGLVIGGTLAALIDDTEPVVNEFTPSKVGSSVDEEFDGEVKKNVNVTNTGDIAAYVRVRLVTYRVNDQGQRIGGEAAIPAFTPGNGWVKNGDYYYYTSPVAPGAKPDANLIDQITLYDSRDQLLFRFEKRQERFYMTHPHRYPVDQALFDNILTALENFRLGAYIGPD